MLATRAEKNKMRADFRVSRLQIEGQRVRAYDLDSLMYDGVSCIAAGATIQVGSQVECQSDAVSVVFCK
jgi:hypothetical protein